jgi:hypothetical protein
LARKAVDISGNRRRAFNKQLPTATPPHLEPPGAFFCFKWLRKMRAGKCFKSILSAHLQDFALATARAGQQQTLFAGRFIKAAGQGQTI